jgi:hypothetical protein
MERLELKTRQAAGGSISDRLLTFSRALIPLTNGVSACARRKVKISHQQRGFSRLGGIIRVVFEEWLESLDSRRYVWSLLCHSIKPQVRVGAEKSDVIDVLSPCGAPEQGPHSGGEGTPLSSVR